MLHQETGKWHFCTNHANTFDLTFSVLLFWYKLILKQNNRIHHQIPFSFLRRRQLVCLPCSIDPLSLTPWNKSSLEDEPQDAHCFVVGSSSWSHMSVFLLARCYKRATWPSKLRKWITAFLPWGISTYCILTLLRLIQEADRGHLGTLSPELNIHLELTWVLKSFFPPSRLKQTRWGIYLELLFLILSFFPLPRSWQWGKR